MVEMKLELVVLGTTDVEASKSFYESLGFVLDTDHQPGGGFRVVQLTPPGSACSITIGTGFPQPEPGAVIGLHLVVPDLVAALEGLRGSGVDITGPFHFGPEGQAPGLDPERRDYGSYAYFNDPDGNGWLIQERS